MSVQKILFLLLVIISTKVHGQQKTDSIMVFEKTHGHIPRLKNEDTTVEKSKAEHHAINDLKIIDMNEVTGRVKVRTHDLLDYYQLMKINNQWRALQLLWEPNTKEKKSK